MEQLIPFVSNHWPLCVAFIVILTLIIINETLSQKKRAQELSTAMAIELINHDNAIVIDIRDEAAFKAGHIIHSIHTATDDFDKPHMARYKDKTIILVCARGMQSRILATQLRKKGFEKPMVLAGGFTAWQTANLPINR
jgi:rhodanese-related sulfurtransferase